MPKAISEKSAEKQYRAVFRPRYTFLFTLLFLIILDAGIRYYFSKPGLILRNQGDTVCSMDYMLEQLKKDDAEFKIAWLGASVMQGLSNTPQEKTYPILVMNDLKTKGFSVGGQNFAIAQHNLGDHYSVMYKSIQNGANIIPISLHYKSFSSRGMMRNVVRYPTNVNYIRTHEDFTHIRNDLLFIKTDKWISLSVDRKIKDIWALYKYRSMIWAMIYEHGMPPTEYVGVRYKAKVFKPDFRKLADYEKRNMPNRWKKMPPGFIKKNRKKYDDLDSSGANPRWSIIDRMCRDATDADVNLIFFFSPLNFTAIKKFKQFEIREFVVFKEKVKTFIEDRGHTCLDMTNKVPNKYFTDFEHLNMSGHVEFSRWMLPILDQAITERMDMAQ